ncbi:Hsp70 family protein [Saccharothrix stipae]
MFALRRPAGRGSEVRPRGRRAVRGHPHVRRRSRAPRHAGVARRRGQSSPRALPTRSNVLRTLASLATRPEPIDTLHFFFSGHGYHSWADGSDYLMVVDSIAEAMEETSLRFELLLRLIKESGARHTVLYLDACRSSIAGGKAAESTLAHVEDLCPPGMVSFCSCAPGAVSYEADELGGGVFTAALTEGLSEAGRCVTVQDLDDYLRVAVPNLSHRTGKPVQHAHTRVEPLPVRDLEIVEPWIRDSWRLETTFGAELRPRRPQAPAVADDPLVAVDFGTSYSAIAFTDESGEVRLVKGGDHRVLVPSVVSFTPDLDYRVGTGAIEMESYAVDRTVRHVKRHLGTGKLVPVGDRSVAPEAVASLVIGSLKASAEEALGVPVRRCIASYPANFGIRQTNALLRAFQLAGIRVDRMVGEPNIATTLLYAARPDLREALVLVVDLGGGTFDVAVAQLGDGVAEIKSVAGSNELGGLDYDEAILGHVRRELVLRHSGLILGEQVVSELRREAERAKRALTTHDKARVVLRDLETDDGLQDVEVVVTRDAVRLAVSYLDDQVTRVVRSALDGAEVPPADVDAVLLSGQGAKIFTVAERIRVLAPRAEVVDQFQELAVVRGLATYANVLTGRATDLLLLDVTQRGIGFRARLTDDGSAFHKSADAPDHTETITQRLTFFPSLRSETYVFTGAGEHVEISVVETAEVPDDDLEIGVVRFTSPGAEVVLELFIDFDANSMAILGVHDRTNSVWRSFQLNQLYRDGSSTPRAADVDLVLPTMKLQHDGVTTDDHVLRPTDTDVHGTRAALLVEQNDVRIAKGGLAIRSGRPDTAMRLFYQVMVYGIDEAHEARDLTIGVCKALALSPERHRAPVVADLVKALVAFWRQRPIDRHSIGEQIEAIRRLGDFPQVRDLEALPT